MSMRILHTMLRVGDLERSIAFYTRVLGMRLLRKTERPEQRYTLAFVGYGDEAAGAPDEGIAPGTRWEDVPPNWTCPECGARKEDFEMIEF